jgi:hypothetical protein
MQKFKHEIFFKKLFFYKYLLIKKTFFEINYTGRKYIFRQINSVNFINFSQFLRVILSPAVKDESACIDNFTNAIIPHYKRYFIVELAF